MSETLWAVAVTGAVTLLATWIGPLIAERATRKREAASRRIANAQHLRPLGIVAIEDTRSAMSLTQTALTAGIGGAGAISDFDSRSERGWEAYVAAHSRARTALTELELATSDIAVNQVVTSLLYLLESQRKLIARLHRERRQGSSIDLHLAEVVENSNNAGLSGIRALKSSLQPLTALDEMKDTTVERVRELLKMQERLAEIERYTD